MGRIGEHLQSLNSVRFEWTVEDQEPCEFKFALDLISGSSVDLHLALFLTQELIKLTFEGSKFIVL